MDIIDRDPSKFDQLENEVLVDEPSLKADLGGVHMSPMVAGPTQFLKNFFIPNGSNSLFSMGRKGESTQCPNSRGAHKQRVSRKIKEMQGTLLVKRVT